MKAVLAVLRREEFLMVFSFGVLAAAYLQIPGHRFDLPAAIYVLVAAWWGVAAYKRRRLNGAPARVRPRARLRVAVKDWFGRDEEQVYVSLTLADLEAWLSIKDPLRSNHRHEVLHYTLPRRNDQEYPDELLVTIAHED